MKSTNQQSVWKGVANEAMAQPSILSKAAAGVCLMSGFLVAGPVLGQGADQAAALLNGLNATNERGFVNSASFNVASVSVLNGAVPALSITRNVGETGFEGALVEDALNFTLGVNVEPVEGLNISADAWSLQVNDSPAKASLGQDWQPSFSNLYISDSSLSEFNFDNGVVGSQLETNGFGVSASYAWDTNRFGQFTLKTTSSYVQDFENRGGLLELSSNELGAINDRLVAPELQSSMMLSWQFGNHTASAITNYFDSSKDISELDIDEINDLVDNITTFDLQYGYSVKTGAKDRAVISFGIRNLFDEKTAQILNSKTRLVDQNGRVAYGSIKYQF